MFDDDVIEIFTYSVETWMMLVYCVAPSLGLWHLTQPLVLWVLRSMGVIKIGRGFNMENIVI